MTTTGKQLFTTLTVRGKLTLKWRKASSPPPPRPITWMLGQDIGSTATIDALDPYILDRVA